MSNCLDFLRETLELGRVQACFDHLDSMDQMRLDLEYLMLDIEKRELQIQIDKLEIARLHIKRREIMKGLPEFSEGEEG